MAILAFQKPDKVIMIESARYGKFEFRRWSPAMVLPSEMPSGGSSCRH